MNSVSPHEVSKSNEPGNPIEEISICSGNHFIGNGRSHTRYFRKDIEVTIIAGRLFERKFALARLIDIIERGASTISNTALRENKKLLLKFTFDDGKTFIFRARVVRRIKRKRQPYIYGAEFESRDVLFKEHLLKTQLRLNLKKHSFNQAADN